MSNKNVKNFWLGFLVSACAVAWLYWLWRQQKEVVPHPLIINGGRAETTAPEPAVKQPSPERKSTPAVEDKLEKIRGIGPVTARRLREAGIVTYAQLANLSAEEVDAIVGNTPWDTAEWITEAQSMANAS